MPPFPLSPQREAIVYQRPPSPPRPFHHSTPRARARRVTRDGRARMSQVTLHSTIACPALGMYESRRSRGGAVLVAHGFHCHEPPAGLGRHEVAGGGAAADDDDDDAFADFICARCCHARCQRKTACAHAATRRDDPEATCPGSLLRRRGGGYFCAEVRERRGRGVCIRTASASPRRCNGRDHDDVTVVPRGCCAEHLPLETAHLAKRPRLG